MILHIQRLLDLIRLNAPQPVIDQAARLVIESDKRSLDGYIVTSILNP